MSKKSCSPTNASEGLARAGSTEGNHFSHDIETDMKQDDNHRRSKRKRSEVHVHVHVLLVLFGDVHVHAYVHVLLKPMRALVCLYTCTCTVPLYLQVL